MIRANLKCTILLWSIEYLSLGETNLQVCFINYQKIDGEGFSIDGDSNHVVQAFYIKSNKEVEFLPENIDGSFPGLFLYEIWNCSIKTVNVKHFKGLKRLEALALAFNEIKSIDGDSFKDLTNLLSLKLNSNKIKKIDPKWFQSLGGLVEFNIGYNQIELLDEQIFDNLRALQFISLHYNELSTIPANLFKNNLKLEKIFLHENKIQTISFSMFDHLYNLVLVDLVNNVCVDGFYSLESNEKPFMKPNCK